MTGFNLQDIIKIYEYSQQTKDFLSFPLFMFSITTLYVKDFNYIYLYIYLFSFIFHLILFYLIIFLFIFLFFSFKLFYYYFYYFIHFLGILQVYQGRETRGQIF